ncbi:MFS transporter [Algivirga pacifica]|uniref:MFS transporter n=2 Tax=Algivirga pacifica TaxID=1162670 RepID=A0ABP9DDR7_9BACT
MMIPELPDYLTALGGEDYKGLIISLFTLTAGLSRPFSGKLTDKVGRVPVMIFGVLVCCICSLLYPVISSVAGFLLLRFFHGFSTGFKPTGTSAYLADIVPANRRGEAMGIMGFFGSTGMGAGPMIGSYITELMGMDAMFIASCLFALFSILILLGMKETLPNPEKIQKNHFLIPPREVLEPTAMVPGIILMFSVVSYGVILTIIPDLSKQVGIDNKGTFFLYLTLASLLIRIVAGKVSDRYGRVLILRISTLVIAIALVMICYAHTPALLLSAAVILGIGVGMNSPTITAWTVDRSPERFRGRSLATMYIALEAGIGMGALGSGWLYHNDSSSITHPFWAAAICCFAASIYLIFGVEKDIKTVESLNR